jgi:hypothetical protein
MSWLKSAGGAISSGFKSVGGLLSSGTKGLVQFGQDLISGGRELVDIATGEYHRKREDVIEAQEEYQAKVDWYEEYIESLGRTAIFNDELLNMAAANKGKRAFDEVQVLLSQLQNKIDEFNESYKHTKELLRSDIGPYILFLPMVIGGLVNDLEGFLFHGDWEAGRNLLNVTLRVVGIVITLLVGIALMAVPVT